MTSEYCEKNYKRYIAKYKDKETWSKIYNEDRDAGCKHLTGFGQNQCAWRYLELHGTVELMGGFANASYWITRHAASYFNLCEEIQEEKDNLVRVLKMAEGLIEKRMGNQETNPVMVEIKKALEKARREDEARAEAGQKN